MPFTLFFVKNVLDWSCGGGTGTRPSARFIQFATGSPNDNGASDGPFTPRKTVTFAAANSPQGSVTNVAAISGCTATAIATALGWNLYDASVGGNRIAYGTMTASLGCASADVAGISAGSLKITMV